MLYFILMSNGGTYTINAITKDTKGNPVTDAVINLTGNGQHASTASGPNGEFSFTGIPAGTYTLTAQNSTLSAQRQVVLPDQASQIIVMEMSG